MKSLVLSLEGVKGKVRGISKETVDAIEIRVEGYTLDIPADGLAATLKAKSMPGLYRGLTTFQQLWYLRDGTIYTVQAPVHISDSPKYVSWEYF